MSRASPAIHLVRKDAIRSRRRYRSGLSARRLRDRLGGRRAGRRLCRGRLLVDPELVDMQPLDLKILNLEVPHDRPSYRQPTHRQCADGAGTNGHRPNCGRPDASRCQLHRCRLPPTLADEGAGSESGRLSKAVHHRSSSTRGSRGLILNARTCRWQPVAKARDHRGSARIWRRSAHRSSTACRSRSSARADHRGLQRHAEAEPRQPRTLVAAILQHHRRATGRRGPQAPLHTALHLPLISWRARRGRAVGPRPGPSGW
jgi:hypothetical protein